jgi:hypothetical protein
MKLPLSLLSISSALVLFSPVVKADVVIFDEGIATQALSIQKTAGIDQVAVWNCPTDNWVSKITDCTFEREILPVSDLRNFVKATTLQIAHQQTNRDLAPFKAQELNDLTQASEIVNSTLNQQSLKDLADYRSKLAKVNNILAHAPDSPAFLQQKQDDENQISQLSAIENQVAQAQQTLTNADYSFDDITHTLADFIKNNNSKDGSPQVVMSSMMKDTLILSVFHQLTRASRINVLDPQKKIFGQTDHHHYEVSAARGNNVNLSTDGQGLETYGHNDGEGDTICNPMAVSTPEVFYVVTVRTGNVSLDYWDDNQSHWSRTLVDRDAGGTPLLNIISLESFIIQDQKLVISIITKDGSLYTRSLDLDKKNRLKEIKSNKWTLVF